MEFKCHYFMLKIEGTTRYKFLTRICIYQIISAKQKLGLFRIHVGETEWQMEMREYTPSALQ